MGRHRKPLAQHELEGTYRKDRHGPLPRHQPEYPRMREQQEPEERTFHVGIDVEFIPKMLIAAHAIARCFDVSESTVRRWARTGVMPAPRNVGGRRLWSADELREWIRRDCPDMSEDQR